MRRRLRLLLAAGTFAVGGCAYKPLKAPCAPDEGGLTVAYSSLRPLDSGPPASLLAATPAPRVDCGPLKPI